MMEEVQLLKSARLLLLAPLLLVLASCQLDVDVAVSMSANGSGSVSVRVVADEELVTAAPSIASRVLVDDLLESGWLADGPSPTADGGVVVTLTHNFANAEELADILNSIGAPLRDVAVRRDLTRDTADRVTAADNSVSATLGLTNGFDDFSDAELNALLGGAPFGDLLEGRSPADVMSFDISIAMPDTSADGGERIEVWSAPLDGSTTSLEMTTSQTTDNPTTLTSRISTVLGVLLVVWITAAGMFIAWVVLARRRRALRSRAG
ncbi:MAG: hypothetical protein ACO3VQ_07700 [Ilumatobacteraceae bacterium]